MANLESGPFFMDLMKEHTEALRSGELPARSSMLERELVGGGQVPPDISATFHMNEGQKFAALAYKIAPPHLVAFMIREFADIGGYLYMRSAHSEVFEVGFRKLFERPDIFALPKDVRANFSAGVEFLAFSQKDPSLLLTFLYLGAAVREFANLVASSVPDEQKASQIKSLSKHFFSSNLLVTLPFFIWRAELSAETVPSQVTAVSVTADRISTVLRGLQSTGLFSRPVGDGTALHCPMQKYLYDLLVDTDAVDSVQKSIRVAEKHEGVPGVPLVNVRLTHLANVLNVKGLVLQALSERLSSGGTGIL